jgi:hypothetical protein
MEQKELVIFFKRQSSAQGIHLMTLKSSTNQGNASGHHFTLVECHHHRVYHPKGNMFFKEAIESLSIERV